MPSWPSALKPEAKLFGWTNLGSSLLYQLFSRHCAEESAAPGVRICVRYAGRLLDVIIDEHADGWIASHIPYACYRLLINLTIILLYLFICSVYAQPGPTQCAAPSGAYVKVTVVNCPLSARISPSTSRPLISVDYLGPVGGFFLVDNCCTIFCFMQTHHTYQQISPQFNHIQGFIPPICSNQPAGLLNQSRWMYFERHS